MGIALRPPTGSTLLLANPPTGSTLFFWPENGAVFEQEAATWGRFLLQIGQNVRQKKCSRLSGQRSEAPRPEIRLAQRYCWKIRRLAQRYCWAPRAWIGLGPVQGQVR